LLNGFRKPAESWHLGYLQGTGLTVANSRQDLHNEHLHRKRKKRAVL